MQKSFDEYFNTFRWTMTVGTAAGYASKPRARMPEEELARLFQRLAAEEMAAGGAYISAVLLPSRVLYHEDWGCPPGGELTYTFSGSCNPAFAEKDRYLESLRKVAKKLKQELSQATVLLEIVPARLEYFRDNAKEGENGQS